MQRRLSVMTVLAVIVGLCVTGSASAVVSSDTLAGPDCNSLGHEGILEEYEDGTTSSSRGLRLGGERGQSTWKPRGSATAGY